jgi:hypothetical protein
MSQTIHFANDRVCYCFFQQKNCTFSPRGKHSTVNDFNRTEWISPTISSADAGVCYCLFQQKNCTFSPRFTILHRMTLETLDYELTFHDIAILDNSGAKWISQKVSSYNDRV